MRVLAVGGGAGGATGHSGGGGAGYISHGNVGVTPGQMISCTIGVGGARRFVRLNSRARPPHCHARVHALIIVLKRAD